MSKEQEEEDVVEGEQKPIKEDKREKEQKKEEDVEGKELVFKADGGVYL